MMKHFIFCLVLCHFLSPIFTQSLTIVQSEITELALCQQIILKVQLKNLSASTLNNIQLRGQFPQGVQYNIGSIVSAIELNINNLSAPVFEIPEIRGGENLEIRLAINAKCELYDQVNMGVQFTNQWVSEYTTGRDSINSRTYSINTGFLVISNIPAIRKEVGSQFTRQITITNSRLGPVKGFIFEDLHDPLDIVSNSGVTLVQNNTLLRIEIKPEHILTIGDLDSLFEEGESIILTENITHKTCVNELINSKFNVYWGCDSVNCQIYQEASQIDFILPAMSAVLDFDPKPKFPDCICDPDGATQEFVVYNNGGAVAENVMITFKASTAISSFDVAFLKNSFRLVGSGQIIAIDYINQVTGNFCLFDSAFHEVKLTLANINPGDQIRILFDYVTCKNSQPEVATNFPYFYSFSYNSVCVPNSERTGRDRPINHFSKPSSARVGFRLNPNENPLTDQKVYDAISSITFNEAISNKNLILKYTIPCPFELIDTNFILLGKQPVVKQINFSYPMTIDLEYLPPFPINFNFQFPLQLNCQNTCLDNIEASEINLFSTCPIDRDIKAEMLVKLCAFISLSCENVIYKCGVNSFSDPTYELPCIKRTESEDTIPAYILFDDLLFRKNIGTADPDDDRFENQGSNDFTNTKFKNFVTGDTMVIEFAGKVVVDDDRLDYDSLSIVITSDLSYSYFTSYIDIVKNNTGEIYSFEYPILDTFSSTNPLANCSAPVIQSNPLGKGFKIPLTPEEILKYKPDFPISFKFENGDSIYCRSEARISSFTNQRIAELPIIKRMALNSRQIPAEYPYSCLVDVDTILLTSVGLVWLSPKPVQYVCSDKVRLSTQIIKLNPNTNNFFSHEYRPLVQIDSIYLTGLNGLKYTGLEIALYYQIGTTNTLFRIDTIPLRQLSPTLFYLSNADLVPYIFDESYEIHITPLADLENCKNASGNITTSIFCSAPKKGLFFINATFNTFYTSYVLPANSSIQIQNANQFISQSTKTIFAFGNNVQWTLNLPSQPISGYLYFDIRSARNSIQFVRINTNPNLTVEDLGNQRFKVGSFNALTSYSIDFFAEILSCDEDTIYISSLWACDESEQLEIVKCNLDTFSVYIIPEDPELELDLMQETRVSKLCDTLPELNIRVYNADRGTATDVFLEIELPAGIYWVPGRLLFSYPAGTPFRPLPPPTVFGLNTYRWNFNDLDTSLLRNGLKGIFTDPENSVLFKLSAATDCNSMVNGSIQVRTSGKNTCGIVQNTISKTGARIIIEGAEIERELKIDLQENSSSLCSDTTELIISIVPSFDPGLLDSVELILPFPLSYINKTTFNLSNHNIQEPVILDTMNKQIVKFGLGKEAGSGDVIKFSIKLMGIKSILCGQALIDALAFFKTKLLCKTDNSFCDVFIQSGNSSIILKRELADIKINEFTVSNTGQTSETKITFNLDIQNSSQLDDDEICFYWILDQDANAQWNSTDSILQIICIPKSSLNPDGSYNFEYNFDFPTLLSCHYLLALSPQTCLCNTDTIAFNLNSGISQVITDSICQLDLITIGVNENPSYKYKWALGNVACDTCSMNQIIFENKTDSILVNKYILLEGVDSLCQNSYEYIISILPVEFGLKTIQAVCPAERISLTASGKQNFRWFGEKITDPLNVSQEFIIEDSITVYLSYENLNGCEVTDSFCMFPLIDTTNFSISNDTTILAGTRITLCATGGKSYRWSPSTGLSCPTCPCIEVNPEQTTTFRVEILDSFDCPHFLEVTVTVVRPFCDSADVFIPNAFSPNADQKNDILNVLSDQPLLQIHLIIYSRWGEKVFESFNIKDGWDGNFNGEKLNPDVFGYYLEAWCPDSLRFAKKGNISLIK
ncbi:MAG: gliding motility-associated C-terminal domain-containing protein [Saprospiraceae bacterium]|nr:gliding motility-associated C-terminal domain-containing protein [Saprospiraceae bacterium]